MNDRPVYRHVQEGKAIKTLFLVLAAVFLIVGAVVLFGTSDPEHVAGIFVVVASLMIVAQAIFVTMTIEVTPSDVRWWFGFGWPGGCIARADLTGEEVTHPGFFGGVGLHLTLRGWLWNVAFGPAVALHRNGKMAIMLGTDDPQGLLAALDASP